MSKQPGQAFPRTRGFLRGLRGFALLGLMLAGSASQGAVNVANIADMNLGTWSPGGGPATFSQDFCVQSDFFGFIPLDWAARLDDLSGASTGSTFRIANAGASDSVIVGIKLIDLRTGTAEDLQPSVQTAFDKTGDTASCPRGLNGRLEIRIEAAELSAASAGRFEGNFQFLATRFGTDTDSFRIRVDVPDLVQVSDLDDIALGLFPGAGDMVGADQVCVYRNDPTAQYEIEARGQGPGQSFVLEQGVDSLPFEVAYDDGSGFTSLSTGAVVAASGADTASPSCGGLGNGNVRVTVRESDLLTADAGSYAGTLTLTVAPI